jgi:hypothetical protein
MTVSSKTVILVVTSVLAVSLFYSSVSTFHVFAKPKRGPIDCIPEGLPTEQVTCCQTTTYDDGLEIRSCTVCEGSTPYNAINCSPPFTVPPRQSVGGVLAPPTGNSTGVPTGLGQVNATSLGGVLPPPTGNSTGVPTGLTVTKALNSASPKLFSSTAGNVTNPSNNTSTLKSSPITGQHLQTSGGHHHHKGGQTGTSASNTNSTGH